MLQILTRKVNFFALLPNRRALFHACREGTKYPPRFTIGVRPEESLVRSSKLKLTFEGAVRPHTEEVQLNLRHCELYLVLYFPILTACQCWIRN